MRILDTIARELFGLFVDDGSLALAILALLGAIAVLMHAALLDQGLAAAILVSGGMLILVENVMRTARRA
jgi:hypothetical protein